MMFWELCMFMFKVILEGGHLRAELSVNIVQWRQTQIESDSDGGIEIRRTESLFHSSLENCATVISIQICTCR